METSYTISTMATTSNSEKPIEVHKLKNKWNLWAHLPQEPDWTSIKSFKKIYQFKTLEEAIGITEMLPEGLVKSCMLFIMKDGVNPMWEDPKNRNGGVFSYKVSNKNVFETWRDLTYVLVGESLSTNANFINNVTGITISPKKNFCIVKIWLTNCEHQNPQVVTNDVKYLSPNGCLFNKHTPEF
jgi:hypothetical protein